MIGSERSNTSRGTSDRSIAFRGACLLVLSLTVFIAVHYHNDGHLDCAKHCPSCASLSASAPSSSVSVVLLSFLVMGTVTHPDSRVPMTLLTIHLYVRPPPIP
jgi:hypothetical protein